MISAVSNRNPQSNKGLNTFVNRLLEDDRPDSSRSDILQVGEDRFKLTETDRLVVFNPTGGYSSLQRRVAESVESFEPQNFPRANRVDRQGSLTLVSEKKIRKFPKIWKKIPAQEFVIDFRDTGKDMNEFVRGPETSELRGMKPVTSHSATFRVSLRDNRTGQTEAEEFSAYNFRSSEGHRQAELGSPAELLSKASEGEDVPRVLQDSMLVLENRGAARSS